MPLYQIIISQKYECRLLRGGILLYQKQQEILLTGDASNIEFDSLSQWKSFSKIDRVSLTAHVLFPRIRP